MRKRIASLTVILLSAGFCAGQAAKPQTAVKAVQEPASPVHFQLGGDVAEIPAQFVANDIFLPVRINDGAPSLFLLDSTTAQTSVDPSRAQSLGLNPSPTSGNSPQTLSKCLLELPGVVFSIDALPVLAREAFSAEVGRSYQGTIGEDFFQNAVVQIDYARKTVAVYDARTFKYSGPGRHFPLSFVQGMPVIRGKFELQKGGGHDGEFIINTALESSALVSDEFSERRHFFSSHGRPVQPVLQQSHDGEDVALARSKAFQIGSYPVENAVVTFSSKNWPSAPGMSIAGEIGGGLLRHFTVIFDIPHKQLILEPNGNFEEEEQEDKSGLSLVAQGPGLKTFEVVRVEPGTPGAEAGIQKGDVIEGIDNDAAADLTLDEVRDLFRQVGHEYKLLIERNGQTLNISIKMRRLL